MNNPLAWARTFLFVPGDRPDRFEKAAKAGADVVVLDLEDAVSVSSKAGARAAIAGAWPRVASVDVPVVLRINSPETSAGCDDLALAADLRGLAAVMVPKAEKPQTLEAVTAALPGVPTIPLIESAAGYANLDRIAAAPGVVRIAIGHIDFLADTGMQCSDGEPELDPLRFAVAIATRTNKLAAAIDGITVEIDAPDRLEADTRRSLRFGFGAKLCIHPRQVQAIHDAMRPTPAEESWARRVIAADSQADGAAVQVDGRMVDMPVVAQARRLLARIREA